MSSGVDDVGRQDTEEDAHEKAVDNLHLTLLDLVVPGHNKSASERARDRERMSRILEKAKSRRGGR